MEPTDASPNRAGTSHRTDTDSRAVLKAERTCHRFLSRMRYHMPTAQISQECISRVPGRTAPPHRLSFGILPPLPEQRSDTHCDDAGAVFDVFDDRRIDSSNWRVLVSLDACAYTQSPEFPSPSALGKWDRGHIEGPCGQWQTKFKYCGFLAVPLFRLRFPCQSTL